ncbi:MAG: two-component regulator propeller domain-containing protein [Massilibacteroides sp.]|nr:two-component regulator propeller domain-containing protein [Massilibacteroides sp.]
MKKILYIILFLIISFTYIHALNTEDYNSNFNTYLAYYTSDKIAEANDLVYAVVNESLLSYNKIDNSVSFYSPQTGLSDNAITNIAYNPNVNVLLVFYKNGNIDLLDKNNNVYNISHFMNNSNFNIKDLNMIDIYGDIAYLSMQFGVIALDMNKKEIKDTYRIINDTVYSVSILNNMIYTATADGLYKASMNDNLMDISSWKKQTLSFPDNSEKIIKSVVFNDKLCFLTNNKNIYYQKTDGTLKKLLSNNSLTTIKIENKKLIAHTKTNVYIFSSFENPDNINVGTINDISSLKDNNTFWIASGTGIMKGIKKNTSGTYDIIISELNTDSPRTNSYYYMTMQDNKLLIVAGGREHYRDWKQGIFTIYDNQNDNKKWSTFDQSKLKYGKYKEFNNPQDFTSVAVKPDDPSTYYIASYGEGLFEIKENEFSKSYDFNNSELESIYNDNYHYIRISGLAFDKDNNLWMTNCEVSAPIKVLKSDGTWASFYFSSVLTDKHKQLLDKILITSNNHKWLNIAYNLPGLFIFKDNDLSEEGSQYVFLSNLKDSNGNNIEASTYRCMAEDKKGNVWVGTNKGPIYTPVPNYALEKPDNFYFKQIIRENENGSYLFLNEDQINAIAVDGGNRKWLGTESSGVFLVSEDGMETILHFNSSNSPLLSNKIISLAINDQTGEVFIGTDKGLVSYMGEAIEGKESFDEVYAFPNPVRPEYEDKVTITGLMTDSNVKITDIRGNLIYQAKSVGGQLVWNCRNHSGSRVATGIYLVIAASSDGGESVVTKIMVVK